MKFRFFMFVHALCEVFLFETLFKSLVKSLNLKKYKNAYCANHTGVL